MSKTINLITSESIYENLEKDLLDQAEKYIYERRFKLGKGVDVDKRNHAIASMSFICEDNCEILRNLNLVMKGLYVQNTVQKARIRFDRGGCNSCGGSGCGNCVIPGGKGGQVLIKVSDSEGDYGWVDANDILEGGGLQDLDSVVLEGNWTTLGITGTEFFSGKEDKDFAQLGDIDVQVVEDEW